MSLGNCVCRRNDLVCWEIPKPENGRFCVICLVLQCTESMHRESIRLQPPTAIPALPPLVLIEGCPGGEECICDPPTGGVSVTWEEAPPPAASESVLQEADRIIHGQRQKDYGSPQEFQRIADLWTAYLKNSPDQRFGLSPQVLPEDVACLLLLMKVARFQGGGGRRDSVVDIAGYAGCLELLGCAERALPTPPARAQSAPQPAGVPEVGSAPLKPAESIVVRR